MVSAATTPACHCTVKVLTTYKSYTCLCPSKTLFIKVSSGPDLASESQCTDLSVRGHLNASPHSSRMCGKNLQDDLGQLGCQALQNVVMNRKIPGS